MTTPSDEFKDLQRRIDHIDDNLLVLLGSRMAISKQINQLGPEYALRNNNPRRQRSILNRLISINASQNLKKQAIIDVWNTIFEHLHKT